MTKRINLLVILILVFTFIMPFSAMASQDKDLFLDKLEVLNNKQVTMDISKPVSGKIHLDLSAAGDLLPADISNMESATADVQFALDAVAKKVYMHIVGTLESEEIQTIEMEIFVDKDTIIIPTTSLASLSQYDTGIELPEDGIQYIYYQSDDVSFDDFFNSIVASVGQKEAAMDLVRTIFERIPDRNFSSQGNNSAVDIDKYALVSLANSLKDKEFLGKLADNFAVFSPEDFDKEAFINDLYQDTDISYMDLFKNLKINKLQTEIAGNNTSTDYDLSYQDENINIAFKMDNQSRIGNEISTSKNNMKFTIGQPNMLDKAMIKLSSKGKVSSTEASSNGKININVDSSFGKAQVELKFSIIEKTVENLDIAIPFINEQNSINAEELKSEDIYTDYEDDFINLEFQGEPYWLYEPYIENGHIMVCTWDIADVFTCDMEWDSAEKVIMYNDEKKLIFTTGSSQYESNGILKDMPNPANFISHEKYEEYKEYENQDLYVPLRSIAEEFGYSISYDPESRTVYID